MEKQSHFDEIAYDRFLRSIGFYISVSFPAIGSTPNEHAIFSSGRCGGRYQD